VRRDGSIWRRVRHHLEPEALAVRDRLGNPQRATVLGDPTS
jgi:hypothetical protein